MAPQYTYEPSTTRFAVGILIAPLLSAPTIALGSGFLDAAGFCSPVAGNQDYVTLFLLFSLFGQSISYPLTFVFCLAGEFILKKAVKTRALLAYIIAGELSAILLLLFWLKLLGGSVLPVNSRCNGEAVWPFLPGHFDAWVIPFSVAGPVVAVVFWKIVYGKKAGPKNFA